MGEYLIIYVFGFWMSVLGLVYGAASAKRYVRMSGACFVGVMLGHVLLSLVWPCVLMKLTYDAGFNGVIDQKWE